MSARCYCCLAHFALDASRAASFYDPRTGKREPLCADCLARLNNRRRASGLPPMEEEKVGRRGENNPAAPQAV